MKSMILTIRLKYFYLTYKGIKTEEIRKTCPKNFVGDVYEYVSKTNFEKELLEIPENEREFFKQFKGKVGLKFTLRKVEEIKAGFDEDYCENYYFLEASSLYDLEKKACLEEYELNNYLQGKNGYAYHIEDLVIFDKLKELSEFKHWVFYKECSKCPYGKCDYDYGLCSQCCEIKPLTKAPQNFMYIESEE